MAILKYTVLRLLLFVATAGLLYLLGLRGLLLLVVALLVSGFVSLVVLSRTRDDVSTVITNRMSEVNRRMQERAAAEDAYVDSVAADRPSPPRPGDDTSPADTDSGSGDVAEPREDGRAGNP